ncbi:MAG: hypothetical protein KatS3mg102_1079 [Planctomycetota bacterium]|nr:MAG: hypothetical protein KatS3mg102_1079 [Planctomycetota bacterium]
MQRSQGGFSLIEVLVALMIVATAIASMQAIASSALQAGVEANQLRIAKRLLRQKAEEVYAGLETGHAGTFEGYPETFHWSVSEQLVPVTGDPGGQGPVESVRLVTVELRYPVLRAADSVDPDLLAARFGDLDPAVLDRPGQMRVTMLLDPPEQAASR